MVEILNNIQEWIKEFLSFGIWSTDFFRLSVKGLLQVLLLFASARYGFWLLKKIFLRSKAGEQYDEGRRYTILQISKYIIYTVVIVIALETIGVKVTALLAASTALFVGLGLGLQDAFKDLSAGVIILMERTLSVGDIIQLENQIGKVEAVGLRTTTVRTRLNTQVPVVKNIGAQPDRAALRHSCRDRQLRSTELIIGRSARCSRSARSVSRATTETFMSVEVVDT